MKKFLPIIIGIFTGIILTYAMIFIDIPKTAYGEANVPWQEGDNWTTDLAAWSEKNSSWKNIFSSTATPGKDLYKFVSKKLVLSAKDEATKVIATNYGLTEQQASQAVNGSISALSNSSKFPKNMTTEKLYQVIDQLQKDYKMYKDMYDIQQQVDTAIGPTEMFANGDLQDSGFDLLRDLGQMEKILFKDETEVQTGKPLPAGSKGSADSVLPPSMQPAAPTAVERTDTDTSANPVTVKDETGPNGEKQQSVEITTGKDTVKAPVESTDVCPTNDPTETALGNYKASPPDKTAGTDSGNGTGNGTGNDNGQDQAGGTPTDNSGNDQTASTPKEIVPADSGSWGKGFCGAAFTPPAASTPDSLGGAPQGNVVSQGVPGFSINIALCIKIEMIKAKAQVSSSSGCIKCEVDKINAAFNKTLGHSMIPNKTTGNMFESALCKKSFGNLLDFQMQVLYQPLPAPPNEDLIFGKNIIDQWNKLVARERPFGFKFDQNANPGGEFVMSSLPADVSLDEAVLAMEAAIAKNDASAQSSVAALAVADEGSNGVMFGKPVLAFMQEMAAFFNAYNLQFQDTVKACEAIVNKECLQ